MRHRSRMRVNCPPLRGKKVLVVSDDRQVSPGAAFISIANIQRPRANYPTTGLIKPPP